MDTAMRDLDHLEERGDDDAPARKAAMLAMAGLATVALVFAMGVLLGESTETPAAPEERDPLAALGNAAALEREPTEEEASAEVDPREMTFHDRLVAEDDRPEVEAALAAAAAEQEHLDPVPGAVDGEPIALPAGTDPVVPTAPRATITPSATVSPAVLEPEAYAPAGDVAEAPSPAAVPRGAVRAASGHDGDYTLQVVSYRSVEEANVFADALRARGHAAFVMRAEIEGRGTYFRVRIGPFDSMAAAEAYRSTFEQEERMNSYVVRHQPEN